MRPLFLLALASPGCSYTLAVESLPQPALVQLPDGTRVTTPGEAQVRWAPFNRQVVTVTATGYRPLVLDLRDRHVRWFRYIRRPFGPVRSEVEFVLVPTHGSTGTWSENDVPR